MELIKKHMTARVASRTISPELKLKIRNHLGLEPEANPLPIPSQDRVKRVYCPKRTGKLLLGVPSVKCQFVESILSQFAWHAIKFVNAKKNELSNSNIEEIT